MATVTVTLSVSFSYDYNYVFVYMGSPFQPTRKANWSWDLEENKATCSFTFLGYTEKCELSHDDCDFDEFWKLKGPEVVKEAYRKELNDRLDWHCDGHSKKYAKELKKFYDMDGACEKAGKMYRSGEWDNAFIKDDVFDEFLDKALEQITVKK